MTDEEEEEAAELKKKNILAKNMNIGTTMFSS
jgi:hypothetical protein